MIKKWISPIYTSLKPNTSFLLIVCLLVFVVLKSLLFTKDTVGIVDVKYIKGQFIRNLAEHNLSEKKAKALSVLFNKSLNKSLEEYVQAHHTVLIHKDGILKGDLIPKDVTASILKSVEDNMRSMANA